MDKSKQENGEVKAQSGTGPFGKPVQYMAAPMANPSLSAQYKAVPKKK